ncbi:MAG TPA: DUF4159 domain-containing protein [Planctomycetota bacterium]|nr:DUF4159 domain-containing protein [Planctomycetota bacterium]
MRRTATTLLAGVLALTGALHAQQVPLEEIQSKIAEGVELILATQRDDGAFALSENHMRQYPVGNTGLAVMALGYARPHLTGELRVRAFEAIRKGIAFIAQNPPEQRTYSAGLIICGLYKENPERYEKLIGYYAAMLILSQHGPDKGEMCGEWGYRLLLPPGLQTGPRGTVDNWGDKSNTQFALLGLYHANRVGFQVPKRIWRQSREHYLKAQFMDGGWGYRPQLRPDPYANMTIASTISLNLCEEMLFSQEHEQCKPPPRSKAIENGLKWIADNWERGRVGSDTYGLYALERLGIIMGRANIGGHDWYNEGARMLVGRRGWGSMFGTPPVSAAFGVMFLARGLEPIVINKLERRDTNDWNNDPYDVKHLVEYIYDHYQIPVQWRIVTLEAPLELLLRTPILYISGHYKLDFNDEEKTKLKAYVAGGGTIVGQACCGKLELDTSFRELTKELFGGELREIPQTHRIYERMRVRGMAPKPKVEILALDKEQGRPAVIYLPHDHCCRWHMGGDRARSAFAVGTGIHFYVTIECRKMYERAHPEVVRPVPTQTEPEPPRPRSVTPDPNVIRGPGGGPAADEEE